MQIWQQLPQRLLQAATCLHPLKVVCRNVHWQHRLRLLPIQGRCHQAVVEGLCADQVWISFNLVEGPQPGIDCEAQGHSQSGLLKACSGKEAVQVSSNVASLKQENQLGCVLSCDGQACFCMQDDVNKRPHALHLPCRWKASQPSAEDILADLTCMYSLCIDRHQSLSSSCSKNTIFTNGTAQIVVDS